MALKHLIIAIIIKSEQLVSRFADQSFGYYESKKVYKRFSFVVINKSFVEWNSGFCESKNPQKNRLNS